MSVKTYVLSIEPITGKSFQYGFHLGTDLKLAKKIAEEKFNARNSSSLPLDLDGRVMKTRTVALLLGGRIVDVYDGQWSSEYDMSRE